MRSAALPDDLASRELFRARARRHLEWARRDGLRRLVEEDNLDPRARVRGAVSRWRWRRANPLPRGSATALFLVGVQRSGTNMVVRGFETSPEFQVHNENDARVFERFRLRDPETVRGVVESSAHRFVLFKPLCDSHRVDELLDEAGFTQPPKALWVYRDVDARARSAVAKFGDANRRVLTELADGQGLHRWQAGRLSEPARDLLRSLDPASLSPESAAALFWYLRNSLVFELGLQDRDDVMLVNYEDVVADPVSSMRVVAGFIGCPYRDGFAEHVDARSTGRARLEIDSRVRRLCDDLGQRLDLAAHASRQRVAG